MKLNLSKFKKVKEDEHSATLEHPSGHQIRIAKKLLSPDVHEELSKLPMKMASGGKVLHFEDNPEQVPDTPDQDNSDGSQAALAEQASQDQPAPQTPQTPTVVINNTPAQAPAQAPVQPTQNAPQHQAAPPNPYANDIYGAKAATDIYNQGVAGTIGQNGQPGSIDQQAAAVNAQNQAKAAQLGAGANAQQAQIDKTIQMQKEYHDEINNIAHDVQSNQIQPNHYLDNLSTGKKIMGAIGLILSGGRAEPFIQQQIQNDIAAQTKNMDSKQNLISAFVNQGHNVNDAQTLAESALRQITSDRVEAAALRSGNPVALTNAAALKNQFMLQNANEIGSMVARKNLLGGGTQSQGASQVNPLDTISQKIPYLYQGPEQSAALKELGTAEEMLKAKDNALDTFDKLNNINTLGNRVFNPLNASRDTAALRDNAATMLAKDEAGRVNEFEFNAAQKTFPQPGDSAKSLAIKRQNLLKIISKKLNTPVLDKYGLGQGIRNSGRFDMNGVDRFPPPKR